MHSHSPLALKLAGFTPLQADEVRVLGGVMGRPHVMAARQELSFEVNGARVAYMIEEGWAYTYKVLANGSRQVVDIAIAGDLVGARALMLRSSDMSGAMITQGVVHEVTLGALEDLFRSAPRVAAGLMWACSRDEALVVEHLVDIGRRSATQRVAHFLLELRQRLRLVGLCGDGIMRAPLSQLLLADALGLTPIHLNRTLRGLKRAGLVSWRAGTIQLHDAAALEALAGYDPTYLDHPAPATADGESETMTR